MKEIKTKHINSIILSILLCMPFLSILARCAYTAINKNSSLPVQSETAIVEKQLQTNEVQSLDDLHVGNVYRVDGGQSYVTRILDCYSDFGVDYIHYVTDESNPMYIENGNLYSPYEDILIEDYSSGLYIVWVSQEGTNSVVDYTDFTASDKNFVVYETETREVFDNSNAFDYSIYQFVKDNDLGNVDLISWFTGMFLNNTGESALYVNFINWYLNYAMLVTLVHFLFMVLMWFICYCRKLLEKGMNYDW